MSKHAAELMESQASNLRHRARRLDQCPWDAIEAELDIAIEELNKIAEALEHAAGEERQAGKRWWREEQSKIQHRPRVDGEIQIPPEVEKWFGQAYPGQELSPEQFDSLDGDDKDDREDETRGG